MRSISIMSGTGLAVVSEVGARVAMLKASDDLPNLMFEGFEGTVAGGDRLWLAPEVDLFYDQGGKWSCPAELDPGSWEMAGGPDGVTLRQQALGATMSRTIEPVTALLPTEELPWAGYRVHDWVVTDRRVSAWHILMLTTGARLFGGEIAKEPVVYYSPAPKPIDGWFDTGADVRWKVGLDVSRPGEPTVIAALYPEDPGALVVMGARLDAEGNYIDVPLGATSTRGCPIQLFDSGDRGFCEIELHAPLESRSLTSTVVTVWGSSTRRLQVLKTLIEDGSWM